MKNGLYLWCILPPAELAKAIHAQRLQFAESHFCQEALKPPVHLTLFPTIEMPEYFEKRFQPLEDWLAQQVKFTVQLRNFNFFDNLRSPALYIDVVKNEQLKTLRAGLCKMLRKEIPILKSPGSFTPHFTIGYRDIPKEMFPNIMKEYGRRRFDASFDVNRIYLLKHNYAGWQVHKEFALGVHPAVMEASLQGILFV